MHQHRVPSKREVRTALTVASNTGQALVECVDAIRILAADNDVTKGILTRPFWGRLRWLVLGR